MTPYKNVSWNSPILSYEIGEESISLLFKDNPHLYTYSYQITWMIKVEDMKKLAAAWKWLATFIAKHNKETLKFKKTIYSPL
jgi:hypothetical protein